MKIAICMTNQYKNNLMKKLKYTKVLSALVPLNFFINSGNSVHAFSQTGSIPDSLLQNSQAMQFEWNVIDHNLVYKIFHVALEQTYNFTYPVDSTINQYVANYSDKIDLATKEVITTFLINHKDTVLNVADIVDRIIIYIQTNGIL